MEQRKQARKNCYYLGWVILLILILFAIWLQFHSIRLSGTTECILRRYTGLYCPGCGGTRAFFALMMGHPILSLYFHPIVPYTAVIFLWYLVSNTVEFVSRGRIAVGSHYHNWYLYVAFGVVLLNWILRNVLLVCFHIPLELV